MQNTQNFMLDTKQTNKFQDNTVELFCIYALSVCTLIINKQRRYLYNGADMNFKIEGSFSLRPDHRETSRDALLEFIVSTENRSACLRL